MAKRYPGCIERRGGSLRWIVRVGGKRHSFTFQTTDRRAVEKFAREKGRELDRQRERRAAGLLGAPPMSELLERFEREALPPLASGTRDAYRDSLKVIRPYFLDERGDPTIDTISAKDIDAFLTWRRVWRLKGRRREQPTAPVSNRTLAKDRAVLHALFAFADRLELRDGNPVARIEAPKSDERPKVILTSDEYERLLNACHGRQMLAMYVLTLGETGARCESEVLWLRWEDIDLDDEFLQVVSGRGGHRTKSGKSRWVPMTPRLAAAMREHFAAYRFGGSPWVFHHLTTRYHQMAGERIVSMRVSFNAAAKRAKLPAGFRPHDLRHRRVTTWLAEGQNPVHVKEAMGHSDLRVTMDYTHLSREHLRGLAERPATPAPSRSPAQSA